MNNEALGLGPEPGTTEPWPQLLAKGAVLDLTGALQHATSVQTEQDLHSCAPQQPADTPGVPHLHLGSSCFY